MCKCECYLVLFEVMYDHIKILCWDFLCEIVLHLERKSGKPEIILYRIDNTTEPRHEKIYLMPYANNEGVDQSAHPRSLISTFVVRCLDSMYLYLLSPKFQYSS